MTGIPLAGYIIGHFIFVNAGGEFTPFAQFLFKYIPGFSLNAYCNMQFLYSKWKLWLILITSFTPVPYCILSVSAGIFEINPIKFCLVTIIFQTFKFVLLSWFFTKVLSYIKKIIFPAARKRLAIIATICILIAMLVFRFFYRLNFFVTIT